jgi:hypothetical protein
VTLARVIAAVVVASAVGFAVAAHVDLRDARRLAGTFHWRGATIVDAPPGEPRDTHLVLMLDGAAARELYDRLGTTPVRDACLDDGSLTRQRNALRCTRHPEPGRYTCDFAIDARSGRLATGQAC